MYDYGARYYDPSVGRFTSVDPMAEKYSGISSYAYVDNNPLKYIDPTGMTIEDPDGIVSDYRTYLQSQISAINGILSNKNYDYSTLRSSKSEAQQYLNALIGIIGELDVLEKSEQNYRVKYSSDLPSNEGAVAFDNSDMSVSVLIGGGSNNQEIVGQEMLHAFQFETGEISLAFNNDRYGSLYDINDETATYQRDNLINIGIGSFKATNKRDNNWTYNLGSKLVPPAYQSLPRRNINMMSSEGMHLMIRADRASRNGTYPVEVFKGWDKR